MTGETTWAIIGPILAGLGVALAIVIVQRGRAGRPLGHSTPGRTRPGLVGEDDELGAVAQAVAGEHLADVALDGRLREEQLGRDLGVRETASHQAEYVGLAVGDVEQLGSRARLLSGQLRLDQPAGDAEGASGRSPAATPRMPAHSRSRGTLLSRKPLAPAPQRARRRPRRPRPW